MSWSRYQQVTGSAPWLVESGDDATSTVTTYSADGAVLATRAYSAAETAAAQAMAAAAAAQATLGSAQSTIDTLFAQQPALQSQLEADIASVANWDGLTSAERAAIMGRVLQDGLANAMQAIVAHITVTGNNPNVS